MAIRVYLEEILKERNMTSKELCRMIGITEANLSILRSGRAKGVRFSTINKICYYLECDVGDILKFDGVLAIQYHNPAQIANDNSIFYPPYFIIFIKSDFVSSGITCISIYTPELAISLNLLISSSLR